MSLRLLINQGSIIDARLICCEVRPFSKAYRMRNNRFAFGTARAARISSLLLSADLSIQTLSFPLPVREALSAALLKRRPIAIVSPTDFIWIPSVESASGNFSNVKRGIFTTQ